MRTVKYYKCPVCKMRFKSLTPWGTHMRAHHETWIIPGWSDMRLFYYAETGRIEGSCVVCHQPTEWNEELGKYDRFCKNPECKEKYREVFKKRMIDRYGKVHLLNDPDQQRKMLKNRKISGSVDFRDGRLDYVGSYEKAFLIMLRDFLHFSSKSIMAPSPHTYTYQYNGENHFYIPDFYIPDINLEVEIKDHETTHPKFVAVDFKKEAAKTEMMNRMKDIRYIVIPDKDYKEFFVLLEELKQEIPESDLNRSVDEKTAMMRAQSARPYYEDKTAVESVLSDLEVIFPDKPLSKSIENEKISRANSPVLESTYGKNLSRSKAKYVPVYIVLMHSGTLMADAIKWYTRDEYSHSAISFTPNLNRMYSFGSKKMSTWQDARGIGFVEDNINAEFYSVRHNIHLAVYCIFVTEAERDLMLGRLDFFKENSGKFHYDLGGLLRYAAGLNSGDQFKYFCSGFVADILQHGGYADDRDHSRFSPQALTALPDSYKIMDIPDINMYRISEAKKNTRNAFLLFCNDHSMPMSTSKLLLE